MSHRLSTTLAIGCIVLAMIALALLAGCATDQAVARVDTVTVDKPVPVPCLNPADVPPLPAPAVARVGASMDQKTAALGTELLHWREYGPKADAALRSCTTLAVQPVKASNP